MNKKNNFFGLVVLFGLIFMMVLELVLKSKTTKSGNDSSYMIQIEAPTDNRVVSKYYQWENRGVQSHYLRTGEVNFKIAMSDLNRQIASFGVPEESLRYRQGELQRNVQAFAKRGVVISDGRIRPDFSWMILQSHQTTLPVTKSLMESFHRKLGRNGRDLIAYISGFVQNLEYRVPDPVRALPWNKNQKIHTMGVNMPIETLHNGWGDCDSKSVLLASLFSNLTQASAIFVEGDEHIFIGVAGVPMRNDHFVEYRNIKYILIETTTPWPVGKIPQENWQRFRANKYKIYQVH